jgi:Antimicrobial peptide resistance and lipid A acylation protein PagP
MALRTRFQLLATLGVVSLLSAKAHAQTDWGIVLNGRSVHVNATRDWNEDNWGLGVEREFNSGGRWVKLAMANGFKDSANEPSYMAGGGLKRRFRMFSDHAYFDIGVIGFVMTREDVRHSQPFPGLLPALSFGGKRVAVNVTYLPEAAVDHVTDARRTDPTLNGVFFIQLKLDASLFGFGNRRQFLADGAER